MPDRRYPYPSREQWVRQGFGCDCDNVHVSVAIVDYATPEEIAAATEALKRLHTEEGRKMKAATGWHVMQHRNGRQRIREALKEIGKGHVPDGAMFAGTVAALWHRLGINEPGSLQVLADIGARYDAAHEAAWDAEKRRVVEYRSTDAAWQEELDRRASVERWLAGVRASA